MKSSVEPLEGNKVKLSVTVEAAEFEPAIAAAWKAIAKEVRIPGFRPGKVPRKVLEARIEPEYARSEAIKEAVPEFYVRAVREHDVDVIDQPEIDITAGEEEGDVVFEATVAIRPEVELAGYHGLSITIPSPQATDGDVAAQIDRYRAQYAEIVTVERPAATDDLVVLDIEGSQEGEQVDALSAEGHTYQVGSGAIVPELDEQLRGLKAGDVVEFDADHPDPDEARIHFKVEVKEVRERVLPELDDAWVADATEFDTVDEFRDSLIERVGQSRRQQATVAAGNKIGEALAELVDIELPDALVGGEVRARLENLLQRLQQQGLELATYLEVTGTDPQQFMDDLRNDATSAIKSDLAFRSIVRQEDLGPSDEELDAEIAHIAMHYELDPDEARRQLEAADQISAIRSDLGRRNALRWLADTIEILDEAGRPVTRAELDLEEHDHSHDDDEHDHDADHDHGDHDHDHD